MVKTSLLIVSVFLSFACQAERLEYAVDFHADVNPSRLIATINLTQDSHVLKYFDFAAPEARFTVLDFNGELEHADGRLKWRPPEGGGTLRYR